MNLRRIAPLVLALLVGAGNAGAQSYPPVQGLQLQIEAGAHLAVINTVAVSADSKLMVTGSDDKTIRLWSLPDGALTRVIRLPAGPGNDGKVYAVALSPDGATIAAGGWFDSRGDEFIVLYDARNGAVQRRLGPLASSVHALAYSRDGRRLAAGMGKGAGLRVWDTGDWRVLLDDKNLGATAHGVSFSRGGAVAVSSYDGYVRLYGADMKLAQRVKPAGGTRPHGIAFSPDGSMVAIGFDDTRSVNVLSGQTLRPAFSPDIKDVNEGNLASVAWSADGNVLYAAGQFSVDEDRKILRWGDRGRGKQDMLPGSADTIRDLASYGQSGIAWVSALPAFGVLGDGGEPVLQRGSARPDHRRLPADSFRTSGDVGRVRFGLPDFGAKEQVQFDVAKMELVAAPEASADLNEPDTKDLPITDWQNGTRPLLSGKPLKLADGETARSLAVMTDKRSFVLGSDWWLRRFDARGTQQWERAAPGTVWGVNVSADGRMIVAAYGDGTIRWHRASDGAELLTLFVELPVDARAERRWVLWSPKFYYTTSPGGERLVGWLRNKSWDEPPEFLFAERLRAQFNRPDILKLVLDLADEDKAVEQANRVARGAN